MGFKIIIGIAVLLFYIIRMIVKASNKGPAFPPNQNRQQPFNQPPPNPFLQQKKDAFEKYNSNTNQDPFSNQPNQQQPYNTQPQPYNATARTPQNQAYNKPQNYAQQPQSPASFNTQSNTRNYYCKLCGMKYLDVNSLRSSYCSRNLGGGKHVLYEGGEKPQYTCRFCYGTYSSIASMTGTMCSKHPMGMNKGRHEPAV
jgi:hypothetical protein